MLALFGISIVGCSKQAAAPKLDVGYGWSIEDDEAKAVGEAGSGNFQGNLMNSMVIFSKE